jgi:hypothetical protein
MVDVVGWEVVEKRLFCSHCRYRRGGCQAWETAKVAMVRVKEQKEKEKEKEEREEVDDAVEKQGETWR